MKKAIFGLANDKEHADRIVTSLQSEFSPDDISVLFSDKQSGRMEKETSTTFKRGSALETETYETTRDTTRDTRRNKGSLGTEKHTKAPEGAATGGVVGGVIGGSLGLLAGIGAIAIPGIGPFIAAGPIMAALGGSGVGGSLGLLVGALVGLGIPEYEAKKYESSLRKGLVLICVHVENSQQEDRAKKIFEEEGAKDISSASEKEAPRGKQQKW